jgi:hypothetical protein
MRILLLLALAVLVACGRSFRSSDEARAVHLAAEPSTLAPGDSLTLLLRNDSTAPVGYNLCTSALERRDGNAWRDVPSNRVCTMELRRLPTGAMARYTVRIDPENPPGEYRFGTGVEIEGARIVVRTDVIQVEPR